ncbi:MAG: TetR/AcrR family transcriptional regulator [Pseudomonadota bacterium]
MNETAVKNRRGDANREALVQSAAELMWLEGFARSSLARIAERAEVPVGNVYYYYKTKAEIAESVAEFFVTQTRDLVEAVRQEAQEPRERLSLLLKRLRSSQAERVKNGCPIYAAVREFSKTAPDASSRAAQSFSLLSDFVASELKSSGVRPSIANMRARSVVAAWQGGIALAHSLQEPSVLADTFQRMEQTLGLR